MLTTRNIESWTAMHRNTWENIDPYSDIEGIDDSDSKNQQISNDADSTDEPTATEDTTPRYGLRTHKSVLHTSSRSVSLSKNVSYAGLFSDWGLPPTPKRLKVHTRARSYGPYEDRIFARARQTIHSSTSHPIIKHTRKVETETTADESNAETIIYDNS